MRRRLYPRPFNRRPKNPIQGDATVVKTALGWEPEFFWSKTFGFGPNGDWMIEPGFALPTKKQALDLLIKTW